MYITWIAQDARVGAHAETVEVTDLADATHLSE